MRDAGVAGAGSRKASGCSTPLAGRPQRPLNAPAATGRTPSTMATTATPLTTWRQLNTLPATSISKEETPRPMPAATARAAGTRTTDSDGAKLPVQPWVAAKARSHDRQASDQKRAAQTRRGPRPSSSGRAAAADQQPDHGRPGRRARWRSGRPRPSWARRWTRWAARRSPTACAPAASVPTAQGEHRSRAPRRMASAATTRTRPAGAPVQVTTEPTNQGQRQPDGHGQHGRGEGGGDGDDGAQHGDLARTGGPPARPVTWSKGAIPAARARRATMNGMAA